MKENSNTVNLIMPTLNHGSGLHSDFQNIFKNIELYGIMNGRRSSAIEHNNFHLSVNSEVEDLPKISIYNIQKANSVYHKSHSIVINEPFMYIVFGEDLSILHIGIFH